MLQIIDNKNTFCTRVSKLGPIATNVCCRYFLSLAFLKKGCFSNSVAVGLKVYTLLFVIFYNLIHLSVSILNFST